MLDTLLRAAPQRPVRFQRLHCEQVLASPLDETFAFFADAGNLEQLTPPWLNFEIRTPVPLVMHAGLEIEYRIRLYGIGIPWRTTIDAWESGVRFVDRQVVGPYWWWHHEHTFATVPGGTQVVDDVEYVPRGQWLTAAWVSRDLGRIFAYRREALARRFGSVSAD